MVRAVLLACLAAVLLAPAAAHADVQWLCTPAMASDPCRGDLTARVYAADGSSTVPPAEKVAAEPAIDCFYVYPTVSNQGTRNATKSADPEVQSIARFQAQRFSSRCRVFAPLYRQVTAAGVTLASQTKDASAYDVGYGDVREAFREYLRTENRGRGFVLVGHSQGSRILRAIIRADVDPNADVRRRMVAAIIPGANVVVKRGERAGGDFAQVPACDEPGQIRCVISYHTFNEPPPDNARFGRTDTDPVGAALDLPRGPAYDVLCTDPAALSGDPGEPLQTFVPSAPFAPGIISVLLTRLYGGPAPSSPDTPWLTPADRYTSRCVRDGASTVLQITGVGAARKLTPSPDATWGVHLVDLNLPMGNLLRNLDAQVAAYAASQPRRVVVRLAARRTAGGRQLTTRVTGTPASELQVSLRRNGRVGARRTLTLGADGRGTLRFRIRRAGSYAIVLRDTAGRVTRSRAVAITLR